MDTNYIKSWAGLLKIGEFVSSSRTLDLGLNLGSSGHCLNFVTFTKCISESN